MLAERYVFELNGYLKALQRLCGTNYVFGARLYTKKIDLESFGTKIIGSKIEYRKVGHEDVFRNMEAMIFNGILAKKRISDERIISYLSKVLIEDINEYFGLVSTTLNEDGLFHPLLKSSIYQNVASFEKDNETVIFWVRIEELYVLVYLRNVKR
ncbi:MAG: hypothetical protein CSA49_05610 [Gammaproteobacteria bacterium]|nr:MAG: hypothetical protein CSA49_05610 [Gammaproteobacteria bacterium]